MGNIYIYILKHLVHKMDIIFLALFTFPSIYIGKFITSQRRDGDINSKPTKIVTNPYCMKITIENEEIKNCGWKFPKRASPT